MFYESDYIGLICWPVRNGTQR